MWNSERSQYYPSKRGGRKKKLKNSQTNRMVKKEPSFRGEDKRCDTPIITIKEILRDLAGAANFEDYDIESDKEESKFDDESNKSVDSITDGLSECLSNDKFETSITRQSNDAFDLARTRVRGKHLEKYGMLDHVSTAIQSIDAEQFDIMVNVALWSDCIESRRNCAEAINTLSKTDGALEFLATGSTVPALLALISTNNRNNDTFMRYHAACAISRLLVLDNVRKRLLNAPVCLPYTFKLLQSKHQRLRRAAVSILFNLAVDDAAKLKIACFELKRKSNSFGALECLFNMISNNEQYKYLERDSKIKEKIALLLLKVSSHPNNREQITRSKTLLKTIFELSLDGSCIAIQHCMLDILLSITTLSKVVNPPKSYSKTNFDASSRRKVLTKKASIFVISELTKKHEALVKKLIENGVYDVITGILEASRFPTTTIAKGVRILFQISQSISAEKEMFELYYKDKSKQNLLDDNNSQAKNCIDSQNETKQKNVNQLIRPEIKLANNSCEDNPYGKLDLDSNNMNSDTSYHTKNSNRKHENEIQPNMEQMDTTKICNPTSKSITTIKQKSVEATQLLNIYSLKDTNNKNVLEQPNEGFETDSTSMMISKNAPIRGESTNQSQIDSTTTTSIMNTPIQGESTNQSQIDSTTTTPTSYQTDKIVPSPKYKTKMEFNHRKHNHRTKRTHKPRATKGKLKKSNKRSTRQPCKVKKLGPIEKLIQIVFVECSPLFKSRSEMFHYQNETHVFKEEDSIRREGLLILKRFSSLMEYLPVLLEMNIVQYLLGTNHLCFLDKKLSMLTVNLLCNFAAPGPNVNERLKLILDCGVIENLGATYFAPKYPVSPDIQHELLELLVRVAVLDEAKPRIVRPEYLKIMQGILNFGFGLGFTGSVDSAETIARLIACLSENPDCSNAIYQADGIPLLTRFLEPTFKHPKAQIEALRAIVNISSNPDHKSGIVSCGVLKHLVSHLQFKTHTSGTTPQRGIMQMYAAAALRNLDQDTAVLNIQACIRGFLIRTRHRRIKQTTKRLGMV